MANMTLQSLDFLRLLPAFMREDGAVVGLSKAMDEIIPDLAGQIKRLSTWDKIDELSEAELDALAWELNILWYEKTASIAAKRDVIKNSDLVYQRLGTKWAVESVIHSYFGDGYVVEWFDYPEGEGEAGHFRVYSSNPSISNEKVNEFLAMLEKIKRKSAKLDEIIINLAVQACMYGGCAVHEVSREVHSIGATPI